MIHFGSIPASVVFFPTRHVASITRYLQTDCRSKKLNIFWKLLASRLHSFACEKNNARVIARNETGPSINRDANFRWSPQAKTITDMRRRDCNLPLIMKIIFMFFRHRVVSSFVIPGRSYTLFSSGAVAGGGQAMPPLLLRPVGKLSMLSEIVKVVDGGGEKI